LIDEVDSTLFPSAQKQLIEILFKASKDFKIQVIFTTHSLSTIEGVYETLGKTYNQYIGKVVALQKIDSKIVVTEKNDLASLVHLLNITVPAQQYPFTGTKIYCEDSEARWFAKKILQGWVKRFKWVENMTLGCAN